MLMSFTEYNDIARMGEFHRKALRHLKAVSDIPRSEVFRGTMPFGTVSVLCLYWNRLGELSHLTDLMDTSIFRFGFRTRRRRRTYFPRRGVPCLRR